MTGIEQKIPVVIVGAGVAGSMLALELSRFGVPFRLIDRLPGPSPYSKAVTVHARSLEIFDRIDPDLLKRFLDRGTHSPGYVMHFVGKDSIRREVRPGLDFTRLDSRFPFLLLHGQHDTEHALRSFQQERYGSAPEWGVSCTGVSQDANGIKVQLEHADGRQEIQHCQYLVACDGAGSRIRQALDFSQDSSADYAGTVLQNLDVELHGFPDNTDWVHYCMGPGHFMMVVKLPGGYFRLLMSQTLEHADAAATPAEVFSDILGQHFDGVKLGKIIWHSRWQSIARLAHTYRQGNIFLAGDAAHVHSTGGGQGLNCCLQDTYNLAWKLALVHQGKAAPALLDTYETERKPIGGQVIAAATAIHELFMAGRNSTPEAVLALQSSGELSTLISQVSGISYHYRAPEVRNAAGLQAGDRAPDLLLVNAAVPRLYDLTRHTGFTLLAAVPEHASNTEQISVALERIKRLQPALIHTALLHNPGGAYQVNSHDAHLYLIRPDGYLAVSCAFSQCEQIDQYLDNL